MRLIVNPHKIEIAQNEAINEKEIDISICEFEFAEEITNEYVKEAYFTFEGNTYKQIIVNNECSFPSEVLVKKGMVEIGVVAYLVESGQEIKRYNPSPVYIDTLAGSLKEAKNTQPITPSEMEQYEQALNDGLNDISEAIDRASLLDVNAVKENNTTTIAITHQDGTTDYEYILDGETGPQGIQGPAGQDGTDGQDAKINGVNTINIVAGSNITLNQTENTLEISSTDTNTTDYTELSNKPKINNIELSGNKSLSDLGIIIPTKTSDLNNDSNFITNTVDNLTNYYKTSETYTKTEVDNKISSVYKYKGTVQTYQDLPSENLTIGDVYNVASDGSNYAWTGTEWDKLGGDVDLSGYQTKIDTTHKLSSDLVDDTNNTHLFVSSNEKQTWNNKSDFSGSYNDLSDKPTIPTVPTNVSAFTNDAGYLTQHQDISGKEDKTNKVVSISSLSTDKQYPSAKCVYNAIQQGGGGSGAPEIAITNGTEPTGNEVIWVDESETPQGYQEIYSTNEQKIGKWIDGKDLYRKVIVYTGAITSNTMIQIGTIGHAVDKVVAIDSVISNTAQTTFFSLDYISSGPKPINVRVETGSGEVKVISLESWTSPIIYSIIKYTIPNN